MAQASPAVAAAPRVAVAQAGTTAPQARPAVAAPVAAARVLPQAASSSSYDHRVKETDDGFHPFRWLCLGLGALIVLLIAGNYFLVDQSFQSNFSRTRYANVLAFAHLGAFVQPNVLMIHVPVSSQLTTQNFTGFLVALAHSTPQNPLTGDTYERIALTSLWTAQYSFSGSDWKALGQMDGQNADEVKAKLLSAGFDAAGRPLAGSSTLNEAAQAERREQTWKAFVAQFVKAP
jgi:hypothetical protein